MKRIGLLTGLLLAGMLLADSCSTTKMLAENEARLAENKISIVNEPHRTPRYNASSLQPYVKQKANSTILGMVNPFVYVWNWQNGNDGGWDRFCRKLGEEPVAFDERLVDDSVLSMLDHLEYDGWYNCKIEPRVTIKKQIAEVNYQVTLGKQFPISSVDYRVRDTTLAALLAADSAHLALKPGRPLSEAALEAESERISQYFRNHGYWGFTKNYFFFYADTTTVRDTASLIVEIANHTRNESDDVYHEHRPYHIGNVTLMPQPGMKVRQKFLHNLNQLQPGDPYSEDRINRAYDRFASVPLFSSVNMMLRESEVDSSAVDCRILLSQARLQAVKFNLEGSFNSTGLFGITPSLSYSHKNIFGGGEVLSLGFRGNFQFMLRAPVRANEFSMSTGLGIPWYPSFVWKMPHINLPQMDIKLNYSYQSRPEYTRNIVTGTYGFSWNVDKRFYYQIYPAQVSAVAVSHMDEAFYGGIHDPYLKNSFRSHLDLGGGGMVYFTTNSTVNPKVSYFYARLQYDMSGNFLSLFNKTGLYGEGPRGEKQIAGVPYAQYVRGELQAVETIRLGALNQYALAVRGLAGLGYAYGNSVSLPFEKLFYAGGANSMRGWRARAVGPGAAPRDTSFAIANQTGDMHLEANVEFRFPMFWKLQGAVFLDAGNVWNIASDEVDGSSRDPRSLFSFKNLARTTALSSGFGARLDFGLVLIRFDLGVRLYDPYQGSWMGINDWFTGDYAFHFGIGYPF